jgi:hypothetical protein
MGFVSFTPETTVIQACYAKYSGIKQAIHSTVARSTDLLYVLWWKSLVRPSGPGCLRTEGHNEINRRFSHSSKHPIKGFMVDKSKQANPASKWLVSTTSVYHTGFWHVCSSYTVKLTAILGCNACGEYEQFQTELKFRYSSYDTTIPVIPAAAVFAFQVRQGC